LSTFIFRGDYLVIAIGANDLKRRDNSDIVGNFKKVLNFIPQDKTIVVSAVLPVDERVEAVNESNDRIIKLNSEIRELAKNYKNVVFVNSRDFLQESDGNLKKEFHIGDGVHLSMPGYQVWINQLRNALENA
jgi:lysophospholipase L1-like esterase